MWAISLEASQEFPIHGAELSCNLSVMRLIGHLDNESYARTFADFLYVQGIESRLEHQKSDGWAIWVVEEDRITQATDLLTAFRNGPDDPKYRRAVKDAAPLRAEEEKGEVAYRKRVVGRRHLFRPLTAYGFGPLTFLLIAASVVTFIISNFGTNNEAIHSLFISEFGSGLPEIRAGQVWRLITPMFVHFSPMHIIFNMWWLRDLGSMIEGRQSSLQLLLLVVVIAACSNLAQYYFGGPVFGGMSGVVYGLFGYIWIRGKFDPASGLFLHPTTVTMMIIWFFLCLTNLIGHVANAAHGAGLVIGMAWGYLSSLRHH